MRSLSKDPLSKKLEELLIGMQHAFAVQTAVQPISVEDMALMERVADAVVKRGMAAPATVFLESMGPMNFLGSQALHFLTPILDCAFESKEIEQIARLLERRDTIGRVIAIIEAKSSFNKAPAQ